ncbi:MAG: dipeptidase [Chloroflexi bacterium]|nr:dipeptidase [Chloroflexota bacterium]
MTNSLANAIHFAHENRARFLDELGELIAIPSISADSTHTPDIKRAAEWLANKLKSLGFEKIQIMDTGGHPVVFGENMQAGKDAPTMIVYGHYDVQPADPLDLWDSPPFAATIKDDLLFARGATDMKGQVLASFAAVEAALQTGAMPVNVKYLLEGEEETGSPTLGTFIEANKELFAADFALNPDAGMLSPSQPSITYALRGLAYFEVNLTGPSHDLHSGQFGGTVRNPANELASLIGGMHDDKGRITLPGFYDKVRELDAQEREEMAKLPEGDGFYKAHTGVSVLWGEEGYSAVERASGRPTLDVNGMLSGYIGEGAKTVLPAKAMAKISCRLVADQHPKEVEAQLNEYIAARIHPSMDWSVKMLSSDVASISARESKEIQAMSAALQEVFDAPVLFKREGGTIPVVGYMQDKLGVESVLTGFGLPEDRMHSPNERLHLPTWEKGIDALIHFIFNLGK